MKNLFQKNSIKTREPFGSLFYFSYLCFMKVRNYYSPKGDIFLDLNLRPFYREGKLLGYYYYEDGWWGIDSFNDELNRGCVKILTEIEPNKEIKKFKFI